MAASLGDKKDAANIAVGLSMQLINAALTLIVLSGAFLTFIFDKRQPTAACYIFYSIAFISFLISIVYGGKGTNFVKKNGELGDWKTKEAGKPNLFSRQVIFILLGIVSIGILPFLGTENKDEPNLNSLLSIMQKRDSLLIQSLRELQQQKKDTSKTRVSSKKTTPH